MRPWWSLAMLLLLVPSASAAVTIEAVDVPERTMVSKPFPVNVTLRNDGAERSVYLFAALYRAEEGAGPCGPAADPRFQAFTHMVQERIHLPADSTKVYPDWLNRYAREHVEAEPSVAEFCVFVANATPAQQMIQYETFASTDLSVRGVNAKPTASFTWDPETPGETQDVRFSAEGSDADGDPIVFQWDFGHVNASGRARATGASPTTFFYPAGDFLVTLTASDTLEETVVTRTITVAAGSAPTDERGPLGIPLAPAIALVALALAARAKR